MLSIGVVKLKKACGLQVTNSVYAYLINIPSLYPQMIEKGFLLIQTKEVAMRPEDAKRVFQNDTADLLEWSTKGLRPYHNPS